MFEVDLSSYLILILALNLGVWFVLILSCVFPVYVFVGMLREENYSVSIDTEILCILDQLRVALKGLSYISSFWVPFGQLLKN